MEDSLCGRNENSCPAKRRGRIKSFGSWKKATGTLNVPQTKTTRLRGCASRFRVSPMFPSYIRLQDMGMESPYLLWGTPSGPTDRAPWYDVGHMTWQLREVLTNRSVIASKVPKSAFCMLVLSY